MSLEKLEGLIGTVTSVEKGGKTVMLFKLFGELIITLSLSQLSAK